MKILALDTTTRDGSLALVEDDRVVAERVGDASRGHAERLPSDVVSLLKDRGLELRDVDLFAVAVGPGSFTGLRVGIATMQGFALVGRRPIVGISALEALAHVASLTVPAGTRVAAWMDAHRRDVFAAVYDVAGTCAYEVDWLVEVEGPTVGAPAAVLERWRTFDRWPGVFAGDGAVLYADAIVHEANGARVMPPAPLAGTIGRLALRRARDGAATSAGGVQPLYVRRPDAEIARDALPPGTTGPRPGSRA